MTGVAVKASLAEDAAPPAEEGRSNYLTAGEGSFGSWPGFQGQPSLAEIIYDDVKCREKGVGIDHELAHFQAEDHELTIVRRHLFF